ncbi:MAG: hypothetical protein R3D62_11830 [Xanthobacteraceae bacterium]
MGSGFANDVADMVSGCGTPTIYSAVVSSQFDADRLDYMRRDRLMTGSQHAGIDFEWLMQNLEVGDVEHSVGETRLKPVQTFVLGRKAIYAAEAYVLGLFQLYPTVYFHKATRGAEKIYTELLSRVIQLIKGGSIEKTGQPKNHPFAKFEQTPDDIECALALDDTVIWGSPSLMAESDDKWISEFAERMRDRKLYKCIDVRAKIAHDKDDGAALSAEADTICAGIRDEISRCLDEWSERFPDAAPRLLIDEVERSPYKKLTEDTKGPLNQINIRTEGDHLVDLSKRSNVVAELKNYKAFRVYHADSGDEAKRKITEIIFALVHGTARRAFFCVMLRERLRGRSNTIQGSPGSAVPAHRAVLPLGFELGRLADQLIDRSDRAAIGIGLAIGLDLAENLAFVDGIDVHMLAAGFEQRDIGRAQIALHPRIEHEVDRVGQTLRGLEVGGELGAGRGADSLGYQGLGGRFSTGEGNADQAGRREKKRNACPTTSHGTRPPLTHTADHRFNRKRARFVVDRLGGWRVKRFARRWNWNPLIRDVLVSDSRPRRARRDGRNVPFAP